jgi:hypothetical protein
VLVWLQLCVLEDKMARLQQLLQAGADGVTALIQVRLLVPSTFHMSWRTLWRSDTMLIAR